MMYFAGISLVLLIALRAGKSEIVVKGNYFEMIRNDGGKLDEEHDILNEEFFNCGSQEACNHVIKFVSSGTHKTVSNQTELDGINKTIVVWKKILPIAKDCQSLYDAGFTSDGIYTLQTTQNPNHRIQVFCNMTLNDKWIVIQRRVDNTTDFHRGWSEYKAGFGDLKRNMWLGLDALNLLTSYGNRAILRIELGHRLYPNKLYFAEYDQFQIANETERYRLLVGHYSGTIHDSLTPHNGSNFSTKDVPGCARHYTGGWWFHKCMNSNLNAKYTHTAGHNAISWGGQGLSGNIFSVVMKIKYIN